MTRPGCPDPIEARHHLAVDPAACGTCWRLVTAGKTPEHPQCAHRATLLPAPDAPCWEALLDIPEDQRAALPARFHTPVWEGNATPNAWLCAVCWGDGWVTGWPCEAAVRGGAEVFTPEHQAASARQDVPAMAGEIRRLTAERNRYRNAWNNARTRAQDHAANEAMWRRIVTSTEQDRDHVTADNDRLRAELQQARQQLAGVQAACQNPDRVCGTAAAPGNQNPPCADCGMPHADEGWPAEVCRRVRAYGGVYTDSKPDPAAAPGA